MMATMIIQRGRRDHVLILGSKTQLRFREQNRMHETVRGLVREGAVTKVQVIG